MALLKVMKDSKNISSSIDYCEGLSQTTETDKCVLKMGYMCDINNFREQAEIVQDQFGKKSGRQAKHYTLNFAEDELSQTPEDYQKCLEMGWLWAKENFPGKQAGVYVHGNTDNVHCHILIHTVDIETGKKLQVSKNDLQKFKESANEICNDYGINLLLEKNNSRDIEYKNMMSYHNKSKSWTENLKTKIDEVRLTATNYNDFKNSLEEQGIQLEHKSFTNYQTNETQNYILITDVSAENETGKERKIKNTTLGKRFEEQQLERQFRINSGLTTNKKQPHPNIKIDNTPFSKNSRSIPHLHFSNDREDKEEAINDQWTIIDESARHRLREARSKEDADQIKKEEQEQKEFVSREKQIQQANDDFYNSTINLFNAANHIVEFKELEKVDSEIDLYQKIAKFNPDQIDYFNAYSDWEGVSSELTEMRLNNTTEEIINTYEYKVTDSLYKNLTRKVEVSKAGITDFEKSEVDSFLELELTARDVNQICLRLGVVSDLSEESEIDSFNYYSSGTYENSGMNLKEMITHSVVEKERMRVFKERKLRSKEIER